MSDPYIHHITMQTGHSRKSHKNEVSVQVLASLGDCVARAESGQPIDLVMTDETWRLRRLDATHGSRHTRHWSLGPTDDMTIVFIACAMKSRPGAALWSYLHTIVTDTATTQASLPGTPWMAAYLNHAGLMARPDAMSWLGDAERCIAWAWIDRCYESD